jgi:glycogen synthase
MKIAILASSFLPRIGGAELAAHNLAMQFTGLGHEVAVVAWWGQWQGVRRDVPYAVLPILPKSFTLSTFGRIRAGRFFINRVLPQVLFHQWRRRFDVWNVQHVWQFGVLAARGLHRQGCPVVATPQGDDVLIDRDSRFTLLESPFIRDAVKASLDACARVTATSRAMREAILALGVPAAKIVDIPNGVPAGRFASRPVRRDEVLRAHGLPLDEPLILSVGRHHRQKGFDLIPGAMERLMQRNRRCTWVVIGAGSESIRDGVPAPVAARIRCLPPLMQKSEAKNFYDHLPSEALIDLYRACDLYVLPSRNEPFGMVVAEALAAGLPVIGTTGMGAPDMVDEGAGGYVVAKNSPAALAEAIDRLLGDASLRERMGRHNLQKARRYDWGQVAREYVECFEAVLNERRRR